MANQGIPRHKKTVMLKEELISHQNDIELRPKFKQSYQNLGLQKLFLTPTLHCGKKPKIYLITFQHHIY